MILALAPALHAGAGDQLHQGIGGIGLGGLMAALGPGLAEQPVTHRLDGGHDHRPHLGVVAHAQVPGPFGIGPGPQEPLVVDGLAPGLGVGAGRSLRPARSAPAARPATTTWPSPPARPRPTDRPPQHRPPPPPAPPTAAPDRAAAASAGRLSSRRAVSSTSPAGRTEVPVVRARWAAAERAPASFHPSPAAERAAASPFTVAARFSIAAASATTASGVLTREQRRVEAGRVATHRLPQLPELFTHQPSPDSEGLTWEGADPSKRTGVRIVATFPDAKARGDSPRSSAGLAALPEEDAGGVAVDLGDDLVEIASWPPNPRTGATGCCGPPSTTPTWMSEGS